jgi:hypothetical protein
VRRPDAEARQTDIEIREIERPDCVQVVRLADCQPLFSEEIGQYGFHEIVSIDSQHSSTFNRSAMARQVPRALRLKPSYRHGYAHRTRFTGRVGRAESGGCSSRPQPSASVSSGMVADVSGPRRISGRAATTSACAFVSARCSTGGDAEDAPARTGRGFSAHCVYGHLVELD